MNALETTPAVEATPEAAPAPVKRPTVHLLPANLGRLAAHADSRSSTAKFALETVDVRFLPDGTYTADATDTKQLVRISGPCVVCEDYPTDRVPALAHAPNGELGARVSAPAWAKAFAGAKKIKRAASGAVACVTGKDVTTFAASNLDGDSLCETSANTQGKFPPVTDILDKTARECGDKRDRATFGALIEAGKIDAAFEYATRAPITFAVDPVLLGEILKTAATIQEKGACRVEVSVSAPTRAILITARGANGQNMVSIIMPLTS